MSTDLETRFRDGVDALDTGLPDQPDLEALRAEVRGARRRRTLLSVAAAAVVAAAIVAPVLVTRDDHGPVPEPVPGVPAPSDATDRPSATRLRTVVAEHLPDASAAGTGEFERLFQGRGDGGARDIFYHWEQRFELRGGVRLDLLARRLPPGDLPPADLVCDGFRGTGGTCASSDVTEGTLTTLQRGRSEGAWLRTVTLRHVDPETDTVTFTTATAGVGAAGWADARRLLPDREVLAELVTDARFRPPSDPAVTGGG